MKINRNNYETYFIDYLDGVLSPDQVSELFRFLDQNPDLREELSDVESIPVMADENIEYPDKQVLKKKPVISVGPIHELNYQEYLIGSVEGDLSVTESRLLDRFVLRNPQVQEEWEQFKRTRLVPDQQIIYPGKRTLKRSSFWISYRKPLYYISGAAASLLALLLVTQPFQKNEPAVVEQKFNTATPVADTLPRPERQPEVKYTASGVSEPPVDRQAPAIVTEAFSHSEYPSDEPISTMTPLHAGIRYQLVSTSRQHVRKLLSEERNLYSQALPYLTASDQYTLSPSRNDRQTYDSFGEMALNKVKELFTGKSGNRRGLPDINLWTLADIGVAGINQLTDSELHIQRIKNEEGRVISYALVNEKKEIARTRTKNNSLGQ
ncbi:MAG TPA: hypothetical protein PK711_01535 [Bacteroidales bacterium]|nr:hypothetical protein [Bacteroidales bacterium]